MHILHLSDLHFGTVDDAGLWFSQLADDLTKELSCRKLAALIISGDIANHSEPEEYRAAGQFIDLLQKEFGLDRGRIIMVPGNHDLHWEISEEKGYNLIRRNQCRDELREGHFIEVSEKVIEIRDEQGYKERFTHFSTFYEDRIATPYPAEYDRQGILYHLPEEKLLILGLNSAWELDHHFKGRASIHPGALAGALDAIRNNAAYQECLKLAVWHHPLNGPGDDRIIDHGFMERLALAGFSLVLHGHLHKAEAGLFQYDMSASGRKIRIIGAGTFGAPTREWQPGYPLQYNLLKFSAGKLVVETRCRREINGAWKPDAIWTQGPGQDPLPRYEIPLPLPEREEHRPDPRPSPAIPAEPYADDNRPLSLPEAYKTWLLDHCRHMDIDRLRERGKVIQVHLPELFIPLYAYPPTKERKRKSSPAAQMDEKEHPVDIESLILENPYLLIKGQPGSGKTTLIRHFCYEAILSAGEKGKLPVLILLKDLQGLDPAEFPNPGAEAAEKILARYFKQAQNGLDIDIVKRYCQAQRAVFLVDGLDEIDRTRRDLVVHCLADFRLRNQNCLMVFSGRPHGVEGAVVDRFGDRNVEILPLTMEQVGEFAKKWFCTVMETCPGSCPKTAGAMVAEMKTHPAVNELKDTPLMLTAICLLYFDGKELPGQRAELYKKFTEYLMYRRFPDPEKVLRFLKNLAQKMHLARTRAIDRRPAVALLEEIYPPKDNEDAQDHLARIEKEFDRIEANCGLLKLEQGKYTFWHLTFQEFLTASALVDRERQDFFRAIEWYWEDDWFKEVVELYIGYLSLQNGGMANEIVNKVLKAEDEKPFRRWRLAARGLQSIHHDRREPEVLALAAARLLEIGNSEAAPADRVDAGEILGRLGDPRDLKRFIPIPGGRYPILGKPVEISPFEIAQFPVTNGWFAEFVTAGGYQNEEYWSPEGRKWLAAAGVKEPRFWYDRKWNCPNVPVVGVSWYEAQAFVQWMTATSEDGYIYFLPVEEQWQAAAAGRNGREFPWEGAWQENRCNSRECGLERISPVGFFPKGITPEGIADLAGNVWEWTSTDYNSGKVFTDFKFDQEVLALIQELENTKDEKGEDQLIKKITKRWENPTCQLPVLRGGSWGSSGDYALCANRHRNDPNFRYDNVGFRCARTLK